MAQARSCPAAPLQPSCIALAPACPRCSLAACFVTATLSSRGASSSSRTQRAHEEASVRGSRRAEGRFVLTYVAGDKRRCAGVMAAALRPPQISSSTSCPVLRAKTTGLIELGAAAAAESELQAATSGESELQAATTGAPFFQWGFYYPNAVGNRFNGSRRYLFPSSDVDSLAATAARMRRLVVAEWKRLAV
ncbi:unnamed protein product [Urochloa humidicola]